MSNLDLNSIGYPNSRPVVPITAHSAEKPFFKRGDNPKIVGRVALGALALLTIVGGGLGAKTLWFDQTPNPSNNSGGSNGGGQPNNDLTQYSAFDFNHCTSSSLIQGQMCNTQMLPPTTQGPIPPTPELKTPDNSNPMPPTPKPKMQEDSKPTSPNKAIRKDQKKESANENQGKKTTANAQNKKNNQGQKLDNPLQNREELPHKNIGGLLKSKLLDKNFEGVTKDELEKMFPIQNRSLTADVARDLYQRQVAGDEQVQGIAKVGFEVLAKLGDDYCDHIANATCKTRSNMKSFTRNTTLEEATLDAEHIDWVRFDNVNGLSCEELKTKKHYNCTTLIKKSGEPNEEATYFAKVMSYLHYPALRPLRYGIIPNFPENL